ncbi:MAG TPA: FeoB-associated Cys-rich membrane protein [Flavobacteriales bacterium]|nr:FeoB-associated Cys-rich membrane protein [Flavobacteriales bacterium]HRO39821.1 FeoB-associated Cys-rich membrane protein [Flavobacteriales bacterium]HRQ84461.1 FeoB-associated Cys-rich membrane protein [Flavobacteriales bacterium]
MQTVLTILIVLAAVAYVAWNYVPASWYGAKKGGGGSCGDCHGCDTVKE